jgi:acetyltransferase-like isoleucine patch superfamily enzyme
MSISRFTNAIAPFVIALTGRAGRLRKLMGRHWFRRFLGPAGRRGAWRALGATIDESCAVSAGVWMRKPENVAIGAGSKLGGRVIIEAWGPVTVGRSTIINDSDLFTAQHRLDDPEFKGEALFISIGDHAWLPRKIIVLPGVRIGNCAVVGTGSVVSKDVPDYAVVAGNPARVIKERAQVDYRYVPADILRKGLAGGGEAAGGRQG